MKDYKERRPHKRYRSLEEAGLYAVIRPSFQHIGRVKDISVGGVGLQYMLMENKKPLLGEEAPVKIDLFVSNLANGGVYLPALTCRLVYDKPTERQLVFLEDAQRRECGLAFYLDQVTADQMEKLQLFLEKYTVWSVESQTQNMSQFNRLKWSKSHPFRIP